MKMKPEPLTGEKKKPELMSYLELRRAVGILGMALPVIMIFGAFLLYDCRDVQRSISAYYHTPMRNYFVGTICAIALFLFAYRGYDWRDRAAGKLGAFFAVLVAFFPTALEHATPCIPLPIDNGYINTVHFISAGLFFLVISFFSLFLFTIKKKPVTRKKILRNRLYYIFGSGMLICLALIVTYYFYLEDRFPVLVNYDPIFWLEAIALWFFGISWLIKGETILKDPLNDRTQPL
jgi:hypothetical protein